jgi:FtsP/CotA-like multicopper oxidase with cupredoxin domain
MGFWRAIQDYLMWDQMRMDPTDFADVTEYTFTYLMNGVSPAGNWTGLFRPGEQVRLRFIDAGAMTFYDVRIPGLKMTVVQVDGQNVQPVVVDEFRMGPAETYDVIVEPAVWTVSEHEGARAPLTRYHSTRCRLFPRSDHGVTTDDWPTRKVSWSSYPNGSVL